MLFQIMGIAVLIAFYSCYFIKMFYQHRKGILTNQLGKDKIGFVKDIEITLKIASFVTPVAEVMSIVLNTSFFPTPVRIAGVIISMIGLLAFILSVVKMGDNWRAGVSKSDKTKLVSDGIYCISRNPAFLGFDLVYIGILIIFLNFPLCVITCFAVVVFHLQIVNVEKDFLLESFGDKYISYKKKVCRYIGRKREKNQFK